MIAPTLPASGDQAASRSSSTPAGSAAPRTCRYSSAIPVPSRLTRLKPVSCTDKAMKSARMLGLTPSGIVGADILHLRVKGMERSRIADAFGRTEVFT